MTETAEQRPVTTLRGVGAALAERLARLGITQVQDLLFLLPTRYEDRTRVSPLGTLVPGAPARQPTNPDRAIASLVAHSVQPVSDSCHCDESVPLTMAASPSLC